MSERVELTAFERDLISNADDHLVFEVIESVIRARLRTSAATVENYEGELKSWRTVAASWEDLYQHTKQFLAQTRLELTEKVETVARVRELAQQMKREQGQSWNSVSGQRVLNAIEGDDEKTS